MFSVPLVCSAPVLRGRGFLRHLHHRNSDIASGTCCIAFAGGGSGGHLTPAIAIAEELLERRPSLRILFFVSNRAVDRRILNASNLVAMSNVTVIPQQVESGNVARSHPLRFLRGLAVSIRLCREHMRRENCGFLLGLGGFASLPAVLANRRLRRPLAVLETNCVPGRANRILNRLADVTFTGWPLEARFAERWRSPVIPVGVPLRQAFRARAASSHAVSTETGTAEQPRLLVLGGSQGARRLNSIVCQALSQPDVLPAEWSVVHQTGTDDSSALAGGPIASRVQAVPFIDDMAAALSVADLVISRAGAVSLAEISAAEKPSILVPLSNSADQHQRTNAEYFAGHDAAAVVIESDPRAADVLAGQLRRLTHSAAPREQMAVSSAKLCRPQAAEEIAAQILSRMVDTQTGFRANP